ncbi:PIF1 helicase-like protein [Trypanosoma grayi]|uniref:PIF1 helicase-like protein n=1 Tax=Trypanosoma grayi TaxID=71804 RepID=UPI0004F41340|nr:PIF1 helicase-like protein [Trypanosoma grayi]KEG08818.1 PIF1 helicase-like protein [Trypanosoma grayi]
MWTSALKTHQHLRTICRLNGLVSVGTPLAAQPTNSGACVEAQCCVVTDEDDGASYDEAPDASPHPNAGPVGGVGVALKRQRASEMSTDSGDAPLFRHAISACSEVAAKRLCAGNEAEPGPPPLEVVEPDIIIVEEEEEEDGDDNDIDNDIVKDITRTLGDEASPIASAPLLASETSAPEHIRFSESLPQEVVGLSAEQQTVFDLVVRRGRSVFLTGGAGTGKSHLLRAIIEALPRQTTFVTATTGIAALNLGGRTLHSFAGCGIVDRHRHTPQDVFNTVRGKKTAKKNWRTCRVLVVDEVSMMDGWFLSVLEYVARMIRGSFAPFGGIQVVFAGDFLQLPPVSKANRQGGRQEATLAFEAAAWRRINPRVCVLSQRFRQKDEVFFGILNEMRSGALTATSIAMLTSLSSATTVALLRDDEVTHGNDDKTVALEGVEALSSDIVVDSRGRTKQERYEGFTILRALHKEVEAVNIECFNKLTTEIVSYKGYHTGEGRFPAELPAVVSVRAGCRVMLLKNLDVSQGLVNGSVGTLVRFVDVRKVNDLAHNTTLYDLTCLGAHRLLPVVRFDMYGRGVSNGATSRLVIIEPHRWTVNQGDREISCSVQIPLQLAYAITIHKSQGMSLSHVNVDFNGIFEDGQAYVALSRCTDMDNLVIENFDASCVNPNPKALAYYKALEEGVAAVAKEEDEALRNSNTNLYPWGLHDPLEGSNDDDSDGEKVVNNGASVVEGIRLRIMESCEQWLEMKKDVVSAAERATSVHGALLVMDITSLLVLGGSADSTALYGTVFLKHQNMMRVPRVVKEELLRTASPGEVEVRSTPTVRLSFGSAHTNSPVAAAGNLHDAAEVAAATLCVMEDAKRDFVLDEQRSGESRPLPPALPQKKKKLYTHLLSKPAVDPTGDFANQYESGTSVEALHLSLLEFASYLLEQYSAHRAVVVCTESIELAARSMAVGVRVCSMAYLCHSGRH